jgi:hypothetical protein
MYVGPRTKHIIICDTSQHLTGGEYTHMIYAVNYLQYMQEDT